MSTPLSSSLSNRLTEFQRLFLVSVHPKFGSRLTVALQGKRLYGTTSLLLLSTKEYANFLTKSSVVVIS